MYAGGAAQSSSISGLWTASATGISFEPTSSALTCLPDLAVRAW